MGSELTSSFERFVFAKLGLQRRRTTQWSLAGGRWFTNELTSWLRSLRALTHFRENNTPRIEYGSG